MVRKIKTAQSGSVWPSTRIRMEGEIGSGGKVLEPGIKYRRFWLLRQT
jgi:hypothetical protein